MEHLAAALACRGDVETAALLAGFVEAGYSNSGYERETTERSSHEILMGALLRGLPEPKLSRTIRRGAMMTKDRAVAKAIQATAVE
ncbi:MAG TPA: hypothetical protein VEW74_07990 [Candidatus Nitrosotalea sp.]|nr:hypothetical protein [Candidatus Nitrosotalea sp.]